VNRPGLIFDCDGVLADTERYGHLPAFNQTFAEFGLPVRWSEDDYAEKLAIGGGKERMLSLLTSEFVAAAALPTDLAAQQTVVAAWHRRKTEIYADLVTSGALPARPGIRRVVSAAATADWRLAVASTSNELSVRAVLRHAVGDELATRFAVFAGDVVARKKPAPDIYQLTVTELGLAPARTLVIEDSGNGLRAARGAGLPVLITVNDYTRDENFDEAVLVVTTLGDPGGEQAVVLADRTGRGPGGILELADLEACLSAPASPSHTESR